MRTRAFDAHTAEALTRFVRHAGFEAHVGFADGVAVVTGSVPSARVRAALEDLLRAHEGVEQVVSHLMIDPEAARSRAPSGS